MKVKLIFVIVRPRHIGRWFWVFSDNWFRVLWLLVCCNFSKIKSISIFFEVYVISLQSNQKWVIFQEMSDNKKCGFLWWFSLCFYCFLLDRVMWCGVVWCGGGWLVLDYTHTIFKASLKSAGKSSTFTCCVLTKVWTIWMRGLGAPFAQRKSTISIHSV